MNSLFVEDHSEDLRWIWIFVTVNECCQVNEDWECCVVESWHHQRPSISWSPAINPALPPSPQGCFPKHKHTFFEPCKGWFPLVYGCLWEHGAVQAGALCTFLPLGFVKICRNLWLSGCGGMGLSWSVPVAVKGEQTMGQLPFPLLCQILNALTCCPCPCRRQWISVCVAEHRNMPWPGPLPVWARGFKMQDHITIQRKQPPWLTWPAQEVRPTSPWHTGDAHSMVSWATIRKLPALAGPPHQWVGAKSWCHFWLLSSVLVSLYKLGSLWFCGWRGECTRLLMLWCTWNCLWPRNMCVTYLWSHWCAQHLWEERCVLPTYFHRNVVKYQWNELQVCFLSWKCKIALVIS